MQDRPVDRRARATPQAHSGTSWLIGWACSRQSRVYAWVLGVAGPEPRQQPQELVALGGLEIRAKFLLDANSELQGLVQEPPTARCEDDRMGPPVGCMPTPSHESLSLQLIDQCHHPVGMQVQAVADGPLTLALGGRQCPQEPEMPWLDAQWLEPRCQLAAYLVPQPRHGERYARRRFRRTRRVRTALAWHDAQLISTWDDGG